MARQIKIKCTKCDGTGTINAFRHVHGGQCFSCGGAGHFVRSEASVSRSRARAAKRRAETVAAVNEANTRHEEDMKHYQNDPRIGPNTRARMSTHAVYAYECIRLLRQIDAGKITPDSHPWIFRNLAE